MRTFTLLTGHVSERAKKVNTARSVCVLDYSIFLQRYIAMRCIMEQWHRWRFVISTVIICAINQLKLFQQSGKLSDSNVFKIQFCSHFAEKMCRILTTGKNKEAVLSIQKVMKMHTHPCLQVQCASNLDIW